MKYVYLLRAGENHYKVGIALNVTKRIGSVQTGNPLPVELVCARLVADAETAERSIHESLHERKLNGGSEWFELTAQQALDLAVLINKYPEIDVTKQLAVNDVIAGQRAYEKRLEKKLDVVIRAHEDLRKQHERLLQTTPKHEAGIQHKVTKTDDELYKRALDVLRRDGRASTSLLQRRLKIGYGRAARLIEMMQEQGLVGPLDGVHREVLVIPPEAA